MWAGTRSPWEPPDQKDGLLAGPPYDLAPLPRAEHTCCRPYWAQLPPPTLPIKKAPSSQPFARTRERVVREAAHYRATDPNSDPHHHVARDAEHLVEEHQLEPVPVPPPPPVRTPPPVPITIVCARIDPSAWRVPVIVTVRLSWRSAVEPNTCFWIVTVGPNVTFTSQFVLVTVIEAPLRLVTVPRARPWEPVGGGVAPGEGHTAPKPLPPALRLDPPALLTRVPPLVELALTLFWPTL